MTTARTHRRNVGRGATPRPKPAAPKPEDFTPVAAEVFEYAPDYSVVGGEVVVEEPVFDPSTLDFDPADYTSDEVEAYVLANPLAADAIAELEANGKNRKGLAEFFEMLNEEN